jgi:hypothetical protein
MWKHEKHADYLYFWDWGVNSGQEWMIGHSPTSPVRGIRSVNVEGSPRDGSVCVTDVAKADQWMILTEANQWVNDDTFSLRCSGDVR